MLLLGFCGSVKIITTARSVILLILWIRIFVQKCFCTGHAKQSREHCAPVEFKIILPHGTEASTVIHVRMFYSLLSKAKAAALGRELHFQHANLFPRLTPMALCFYTLTRAERRNHTRHTTFVLSEAGIFCNSPSCHASTAS